MNNDRPTIEEARKVVDAIRSRLAARQQGLPGGEERSCLYAALRMIAVADQALISIGEQEDRANDAAEKNS